METIIVKRDEQLPRLVTITLNRPVKLNAISFRMHQEVQQACRELADDAKARVVILAGAGRKATPARWRPRMSSRTRWLNASAIRLGTGPPRHLSRCRR